MTACSYCASSSIDFMKTSSRPFRLFTASRGFTLIELLTVIAIIAVLASLILMASGYAQKRAAGAKAESQIRALETACEAYKVDNAVYPRDSNTDKVDPRTVFTPNSYKTASLALYALLNGDANYDGKTDTDSRSYLGNTLTPEMLGRTDMNNPVDAKNVVTYLADPFGNSFGYSTANAKYQEDLSKGSAGTLKGFNATYDLWSTNGDTRAPTGMTADKVPERWIKNW